MSCECPAAVLAVLNNQVLSSLTRVQQLLYFVGILQSASANINDETVVAVGNVTNTIPTPATVSVTDLAQFFTCPLVGTALLVQAWRKTRDATQRAELNAATALASAQELPPEGQVDTVRNMYGDYTRSISSDYHYQLSRLKDWGTVQSCRQYIDQAQSIGFNAAEHAFTLTVTAQVKLLCDDHYYGTVHEQYDNSTINLQFDNLTGLPAGTLTGPVTQVLAQLASAESKLAGWRSIAAGL